VAQILSPALAGIEIVPNSVVIKAIAETSGKTLSGVKSALSSAQGDEIIDIACSLRTSQRRLFTPRPLDFFKAYETIKSISLLGGKELPKRFDMVKKLMVEVQEKEELRLIMRSLQGTMRQAGYSISFVIRALARAIVLEAPHGRGGASSTQKEPGSDDAVHAATNLSSFAHTHTQASGDSKGTAWLAEEAEGVIHEAISHVPNLDTVVSAVVQHGTGVCERERERGKQQLCNLW
jgi:hypothetical protein